MASYTLISALFGREEGISVQTETHSQILIKTGISLWKRTPFSVGWQSYKNVGKVSKSFMFSLFSVRAGYKRVPSGDARQSIHEDQSIMISLFREPEKIS